MKRIGIVIGCIFAYVVLCMIFDPYGYGAAHDARMSKAYDICVTELGITEANGHTSHAQHQCIMRTADLIERGAKL